MESLDLAGGQPLRHLCRVEVAIVEIRVRLLEALRLLSVGVLHDGNSHATLPYGPWIIASPLVQRRVGTARIQRDVPLGAQRTDFIGFLRVGIAVVNVRPRAQKEPCVVAVWLWLVHIVGGTEAMVRGGTEPACDIDVVDNAIVLLHIIL